MNCRRLATLTALAAALLAGPAGAAEPVAPTRDPMLPPPAARPAVASPTAPAETAATPSATLRQILVVDGRRFVVEGTRLRGVGDRLGNARIERIADDAAWVRENGVLHRLPLHGGVVKKAAVESAPAPDDSASDIRPRRPVLARAPTLRPAGESP